MAETRRFAGLSTRSQLSAANRLGVVTKTLDKNKVRNTELELYDTYYEGDQYEGLPAWDTSVGPDNEYIPVRKRAPLLNYKLGQLLVSRLASKLLSQRSKPEVRVEDDPDTQAFLQIIIQNTRLFATLLEPLRRNLAAGSVFVRFAIVNGQYKVEHFLSKWCYPKFDDLGNLIFIEIKYEYEDEDDLDAQKNPKKKWFKMELGPQTDILYDNPESKEADPVFTEVSRVEHGLGFVQGEWFKTCDQPNEKDGESLLEPILGFIDEFNYSLSQSSTAISYNQDPQLAITNMDEEDLEKLIRSSSKAWNLGKEGTATFIEGQLSGVEAAGTLRDKVKIHIQDLTRVIMLDPEKIVGSAQSAKAMEVLHGPMVELVEELRPQLEKHLNTLLLKLALATLILNERGEQVPIEIPTGYKPVSTNVLFVWPPVFPLTMEDLQKKVQVASALTSASIFSRETMTRWLAKDFGIENVEEEIAKVAAQPVLNPFGGF